MILKKQKKFRNEIGGDGGNAFHGFQIHENQLIIVHSTLIKFTHLPSRQFAPSSPSLFLLTFFSSFLPSSSSPSPSFLLPSHTQTLPLLSLPLPLSHLLAPNIEFFVLSKSKKERLTKSLLISFFSAEYETTSSVHIVDCISQQQGDLYSVEKVFEMSIFL